jgi:hypothetical protein
MDRKLTAEFILRFDTLASKFIFVSDVPSVFFDLDFEMELYDKYMMENFKHSVMDVYYFVIKAEEGEIITFNIEKSYAQNLYDNRFVLIKHFFDT